MLMSIVSRLYHTPHFLKERETGAHTECSCFGIAVRICYHKSVPATVANIQCIFATVANTHSAYLLPQMRICYRRKYSEPICYHKCVFATINAYLLPQMRICYRSKHSPSVFASVASINDQFSNSNKYTLPLGIPETEFLIVFIQILTVWPWNSLSCFLSTALVFAKLLSAPKHSGAVTQRMQYYIPPFLGHFNLTWKKKTER